MNKKIKSGIIACVAITMQSCYDVLEQMPTDRYSDAVVWSDPAMLEAHLAELYECTTVMIQDATASQTPTGSSMNIDGSGWYDIAGFSAQMEGSVRPLDVSDETKYCGFGAQSNLSEVKHYGLQPNSGWWQWWGNAYYVIRLLNNFIDYAADSPIPEANIRIGEARFLRAFCYFGMVKRYGGVPLITEVLELTSDSIKLYPKRNTEKEIYDFILKETDEISKILPPVTDAGRASKWAALALRSRVALFAGSIAQYGKQPQPLDGLLGFPASDAPVYYQMCYDACTEIMTKSSHDLYKADKDKVQNFKNIFLRKGNIEGIMVKQHNGPVWQASSNRWSWDMCQCPRPSAWGVGNNNCPYLEMVEEFELKDGSSGVIDKTYAKSRVWSMEELWGDRDPRFKASIWTNGDPWPKAEGGVFGDNHIDMHLGIMSRDGILIDGRYDSYEGNSVIGDQVSRFKEFSLHSTGFGVMKYLDPTCDNVNSWFMQSTTDYLIFRYAEILLNYAEAAFELNQPADALDAVNKIRDRAGIALLADIDREKIRHERKVELLFENHRYWDLRRWRIAVEKLTRTYTGLRYIYDAATGKYWIDFIDNVDGKTQTPTFPAKNYYFPIGQGRIGANHNLVENPDY